MRNNNPLNIRWNRQIQWLGQIGHDEKGFCQFNDLLHGVRAVFSNLRSYRVRHNITKLSDIVGRWAPPNENNTAKYIADVCSMANLNPDSEIDYRDEAARRLVKAMARIESNMVLPDEIVLRAQLMIL